MFEALHPALDAIPTAIFLYQPDRVLYANRAAAALMGWSQAEIAGRCFGDLFDDATVASSSAALKTRSGQIPVTLTSEEIDLEGTRLRVITALKREAAEVVPSDGLRLFASLFESAVVGVAIVNAQGYYTQVNPTYGELYGYSARELLGQHFSLVFPPENDDDTQENHDRVIRGETPSARTDWTVARKDGQPTEITAFNNLYISESGERFRVVVLIDNTEQIQTQKALEASEQGWNGLMNSMGDAMWSISAETYQVAYVNPAIEAMTGYSVEEFMAYDGLLFEIVHPEDRPYFLEQMHKALSGEKIDIEHRIIRRDGVICWIHKRFWLVRRPDGNRISGLMTDITDRRLAVDQAMQLGLENERVRILSNFVRDASHEFRTPLAVINMRLELMERTTDPEQHFKYIQRIKGQTDRILKLVEALILMSRLDNQTRLQLERINLNPILDGMNSWMKTSAERNELAFTCDLPSEPLYIQGAIHEIVQAVDAIFDNALAFTRPGGSIHLHSYALNDQEIAVEMRDSGIGIDAAHLPHIFERFYRGDQAHSTQGFGLGLPIARRIAELHHGRIEVESSPGKGSLFRLIFPADRPE